MTNLDLYAKAEHLLGIEEATEALYNLYRSELSDYKVKTLLDVGCGRGGFMHRMQSDGVTCKGIDLSSVMVEECREQGLDVTCMGIEEVQGQYDAVVAIFDVLNFLDTGALQNFLLHVERVLKEDGIFIADINTLYGFEEVAEGSMAQEEGDEFLIVDARFEDEKLDTTFTLFEKHSSGLYEKHQDTIRQYYHKEEFFKTQNSLTLKEAQTFSLYDTHDKTLLIFQKNVT